MDTELPDPERAAPRGVFVTTQWSVVLAAAQPQETAARTALARLCEAYWHPLYAYVRKRGYHPEDAQDLTQSFFAELLEHNWVARADPSKGRFRSFLLMAMARFLANEWDRLKTQKRGGGIAVISLEAAETKYQQAVEERLSPDQVYEKHWVLAMLDRVLDGLRKEYTQDGKEALFNALKLSLVGSRETQPYAVLAAQLDMNEGAVKVAVSRLRARYRERLREEISQTVAEPGEVEEEIQYLFRVMARHG